MRTKIDPRIREEIQTIVDANGGHIRPQDIVEFATENPDSALYKTLEWDNDVAGPQFRLVQARRLIVHCRIEIEVPDEDRTITVREFTSLTGDRMNGGGYRLTGAVMASDELREMAIADARRDADVFRRKYQHLSVLAPVIAAMDGVFEAPKNGAKN